MSRGDWYRDGRGAGWPQRRTTPVTPQVHARGRPSRSTLATTQQDLSPAPSRAAERAPTTIPDHLMKTGIVSTANRGRLLSAAVIRQELFANSVSDWWIRKHVAPKAKIRLGHSTVVWYERDIQDWLESRKGL